jgi:hypothetical protein
MALSIATLIGIACLLRLVGWLVLDWYMGWTQREIDAAIKEFEEEQRSGVSDWPSDMIVVSLFGITTLVFVVVIFGLE